MHNDVRSDKMKKIPREQAIEKAIKLANEIAASRKVRKLFELAQEGHRMELEEKTNRFMNSKLYKKIEEFDEEFPKGPLFIAKIKENIKAYRHTGLKPYDKKIDPKSMVFLILVMPTHEEKDFFENYDDLVYYLKESKEEQLADFLKRHWLSGNIADMLWEMYDEID